MSESWLVFDPYLASSGGGERYMFALVTAVAECGKRVVIAGPNADLPKLRSFGFPEAEVRPMTTWGFVGASRRFRTTVSLSNHPPPPSLARHAVVVVQFPFTGLSSNPLRRLVERWMLRRSHFVVYSEFARGWLRERWGVHAVVLPPPVELGDYRVELKRRVILNVGRFFPSQHSKRQDALVAAFAALPAEARAGWRLVLAGGVADDPASQAYVADVRRKADGLHVEVVANVDAAALRALYAQATLYWHATGLDRDEDEPEKAEHFGMTTVEAMSYGAVPVVIDDGGQPEIVTAATGVLWRDRADLVAESAALMRDRGRCDVLARAASLEARRFGPEAFRRGVAELVGRVGA